MANRASKPAKGSPSARPSNAVARARADKGGSSPIGRWLWENFKSLLGAIIIYLFVKTLFVEAYRIPSGSMIPTLLVGDWLFVNKLAYGPTIPFTNAHLPGYSTPHHSDVLVFVSPYQADNAPDYTPILVKRLIGMPGDTLYMRDGQLYLDGVAQQQVFPTPSHAGDPRNNQTDQNNDFDWQHKIEAKGTRFGPPPAAPTLGNWGPLIIPRDNYFMMGDNRYCSKDSRYWGTVPKANIRGRPLFVYYSYRPGGTPGNEECDGQISDRALPFITDIRWSRIGHWIK
ncbi:MAG TPA: signal peptidase I [Gemmatimonadaceae bacterium]|nr:signal peptidase I [Gemmatimonadaceae bacterium]